MEAFQWVLFLVIGGIGGFIGNRLKLPAGTLMGAMLAVGICKYFGLFTIGSNKPLTFIMQLSLGLTLGVSLASLDKKQVIKLAKVLLIVTVAVLIMTFVTGYLLSFFTKLDLRTILLSTAPGGLAEMSIIAKSVELNSPVVAVLHIVRLLIVLSIFPFIIKIIHRKMEQKDKNIVIAKQGRGETVDR